MTGATERETKVGRRMVAEEVASCNCDWGCPCQFDPLPPNGNCEALVVLVAPDMKEVRFGATKLDDALRDVQLAVAALG